MAKSKAGDNRYNEFADIGALEKQQEAVLKIFKSIEASHKKVSNLQVKIGGAQSIKAVTDAEVQYQAAFKEVLKLQKDYSTNEAKLQILRSKEYEQVQRQKLAISQLRKEQELRLKLRNAEEGSLDQMNLKFQKATKIIAGFSEAQRASTRGQNFIKYAGDISNAINEIQKKAGNFRNNVGRYAESLGDGFELVRREITKLQREAAKLEQGGDIRGAENVRRSIEDLDRVQKISFNGNQTFSKSVRQLEREFQNLAASGTASNEFLEEFKKFVAQAKDQAEDLKAEIKALSSDTRAFDLVAESIGTVASSFEAITGAQALFGQGSEEVQKNIQKLVAVQSVANGIRQVATDLTTKGSAANKFYAFTQGLMATAMDKTAASATRLKAALGLIGIAITVIGAIAIAFDVFKRKLSEAEKAQERYNKVNEQAIEGYAEQQVNIQNLVARIKDENTTNGQKRQILEEVNEKYGDQIGKLTDINQLETVFIANAEKIILQLKLKAKAQAAYSLAVEAAKDEIKLLNLVESGAIAELPKRFRTAAKESLDASLVDAAKAKDDYLKIYTDLQKDIQKINFGTDALGRLIGQGAPEEKKDKGADKSLQDKKDRTLKAALELKKIELEAAAGIQLEILSIETFGFNDRLNAYQEYIRIKNQIIDAEAEYEAGKAGVLDIEKKLILKNAYDAKIQLAKEAGEKLAKLAATETEAVVEEFRDLEAESAAIGDAMNAKFEQQLQEASTLIDTWTKQKDDRIKTLKATLVDAFQSTMSGIFDAQKNRIQEQIDDIERLKQAEIDRINGTTEGEEKKAARIKIVEAKAQADREALERRQRRIDVQRAIFERAFRATQLTFEGIKTVGAIKLELAKATAASVTNPFLLPFLPLIASQIPIAIATTAASLVSLLASPIPKFWTGTESAPEGFAHLAERGRELTQDPSGNVSLIEKPTIGYLKKGTKVFNNQVTEQMLSSITTNKNAWIIPEVKDTKTDEVIAELKKMNDKKPAVVHINNGHGIETSVWYGRHIKN